MIHSHAGTKVRGDIHVQDQVAWSDSLSRTRLCGVMHSNRTCGDALRIFDSISMYNVFGEIEGMFVAC